MEPVILTQDLRKNFGNTAALDGLDLRVEAGTVHGFLGPNGAGKSTTIRILLGLIRRSGGQVSLFGKDPWHDAVELHRRLAYVPGELTLWPGLTGGEAIDLMLRLRGGAADDAARSAEKKRLIDAFELDPTKKCRSYSKGNRQKVALVAALAAQVELYVLDEPTSGLDPLMEQVFQNELRALRDKGSTVLLSSHILSEVEEACSVVTIVRAGKAVESGDLDTLRHLHRTVVRARLEHPIPLEQVNDWPGVHDAAYNGEVLSFGVDPDAIAAPIAKLEAAGLKSLECSPPSLEELFLDTYRPATA